MTPKAISHTQSDVKIEQHPHMREMSIGELVAQHMNEENKWLKCPLRENKEVCLQFLR